MCNLDNEAAGEEEVVWSLRSDGDLDVSKLAALMGGGGHKNAAGFIVYAGFFPDIPTNADTNADTELEGEHF